MGDMITLHVITTMTSKGEPSLEQGRALKLLREMAKQDAGGPWAQAFAMGMTKNPNMMAILTLCISHMHSFIPNQLLLNLNIQVGRHM